MTGLFAVVSKSLPFQIRNRASLVSGIALAASVTAGAAGAALGGCVTGAIGDPDGPSIGTGSSASCASGAATPATPARVRRLTAREYDATVRALIGAPPGAAGDPPSKDFPPEDRVNGYTNNADALVVTPLLAEALATAAEKLATQAVTNLAALVPCDPASFSGATPGAAEQTCARGFITSFGKKAFRRPLAQDEVDAIYAVYAAGRDGADFKSGIELALEYFFQSPSLLYKTELGNAGDSGKTRLAGYETATALSYLLTGGPPDDALVAAAEAGDLDGADGRAAQAMRLLASPDARAQVAAFVAQWLGIDKLDFAVKDPTTYPDWNDGLRASMKAETDAFVGSIVFDGDASLKTLLTSSDGFVDANLAALYGVAAPSGAGLQRVPLDPTQRAGLLTQGSLLTTYAQAGQTSPVRRGKFVRTRLLCQDIPPPPRDIVITPPPPSTQNTTRDRFSAHTSSPACQSCHVKMDPIGFGFENYDAIGKYRTTENGFPVDGTGSLHGTSDQDGDFDGLVQLAHKLADSRDVRACFAKNWLRFGLARTDRVQDRCTLTQDFKPFQDGSASIRDLVVALVRSDAFVTRSVDPR